MHKVFYNMYAYGNNARLLLLGIGSSCYAYTIPI